MNFYRKINIAASIFYIGSRILSSNAHFLSFAKRWHSSTCLSWKNFLEDEEMYIWRVGDLERYTRDETRKEGGAVEKERKVEKCTFSLFVYMRARNCNLYLTSNLFCLTEIRHLWVWCVKIFFVLLLRMLRMLSNVYMWSE